MVVTAADFPPPPVYIVVEILFNDADDVIGERTVCGPYQSFEEADREVISRLTSDPLRCYTAVAVSQQLPSSSATKCQLLAF